MPQPRVGAAASVVNAYLFDIMGDAIGDVEKIKKHASYDHNLSGKIPEKSMAGVAQVTHSAVPAPATSAEQTLQFGVPGVPVVRRFPLSPYEIFMRVFEGLGGIEGMIKHYLSNPKQATDRRGEFYSMFRVLLPRETNVNLRQEAPGDVYLVGLDPKAKDKDNIIDALPDPGPGPAGSDPATSAATATPEAIARLIDAHDPQAARDDDTDRQVAPKMLRKGKG